MPKSFQNISSKIWANLAEILFQLELGFLEVYIFKDTSEHKFSNDWRQYFQRKNSHFLHVLRALTMDSSYLTFLFNKFET
jgi:hypothetical protein